MSRKTDTILMLIVLLGMGLLVFFDWRIGARFAPVWLLLSGIGWIAWWRRGRTVMAQAESAEKAAEVDQVTQRMTELEIQLQREAERLFAQQAKWEQAIQRAEQAEAQVQAVTQEADALTVRWNTLSQTYADLDRELQDAQQTFTTHQTLKDRVAKISDELASQVLVAMQEAEQAIEAAIGKFYQIASEAQEASEISHATLGEHNEMSVTHTVGQAAEVMRNFVSRMVATGSETAASAQQVQQVSTVAKDLYQLLDEVESLADQTRLLALNATIEAARAGEAGRGFAVVAAEVGKLSDRSRQSAERMRQLTTGLGNISDTVCKVLIASADQSLQQSNAAQETLDQLFQTIREGNAATQEALGQLSGRSQALSENIQRIVMTFQFHDLLRQRLEHVVDPLTDLRDEMRGQQVVEAKRTGTDPGIAPVPLQRKGLSVGAAPELTLVRYEPPDEGGDNVTLF